eukprot:m.15277 g.15277  ORF g.15277 m.15277 type:complete len:420 (+) comp8614_c0_seq2:79-1338(+)
MAARAVPGSEVLTEAIKWLRANLSDAFGPDATFEAPLHGVMGCRLTNIDLRHPLTPAQAELLVEALPRFRVLCISGQDVSHGPDGLSLQRVERLANHFGAMLPHPNNFVRGGKPAQGKGDSKGPITVLPYAERPAAKVDAWFGEDRFRCLEHTSPAVLTVSNIGPAHAEHTGDGTMHMIDGTTWHTDIEYEPEPLHTSMFLVQRVPLARQPHGGTWVTRDPAWDDNPWLYEPGAAPELTQARLNLPLNGETPFADTVAALQALPAEEQAALEKTTVRRRLNAEDEGWLAPLVRTCPLTGIKGLHSPFYNSRPQNRPPVEVNGLSFKESRQFLDRLETHVLQPEFRYDHVHTAGDVTIWHNWLSVHNGPPLKVLSRNPDDTRLMFRLSCKGPPCYNLPRRDSEEWLKTNISPSYTTPAHY